MKNFTWILALLFSFGAFASYTPNAVTVASTSKIGIEYAVMSGTCSSGNCTLSTKTNGVNQITWSSSGTYGFSFVAGTYSAAPACFTGSMAGANITCEMDTISATGGSLHSYSISSPGFVNGTCSVFCIGPR